MNWYLADQPYNHELPKYSSFCMMLKIIRLVGVSNALKITDPDYLSYITRLHGLR